MTRIVLLAILLLAVPAFLYAQAEGPREITPQELAKMKMEVDEEAVSYRKALDSAAALSVTQIEFMTDTLRINRLANRMTDIDYSSYGINQAIDQSVKAYDKLLNKYYQSLLDRLQGDDRNVLIEAQRKWLAFRDAELHLLGVLTKDEYSGGGTVQSNILGASYADRIVNRVVELFYMMEGIQKK